MKSSMIGIANIRKRKKHFAMSTGRSRQTRWSFQIPSRQSEDAAQSGDVQGLAGDFRLPCPYGSYDLIRGKHPQVCPILGELH